MDKEHNGSQPAAQDLTPADQATPAAQSAPEGKTPADFIARAEQELAQRAQGTNPPAPAAAAPQPQTPEQKARREKMEKMISGWPEEDKKLFASAPDNLRDLLGKYYHHFQSDYTKKTQQAAALRAAVERELSELSPVVSGRFRDMRQFVSYVSDMQNFEREFQRDPVRALNMLMQTAGIRVEDLADYQPNAAAEAVRPLQAQLAQLQKQLQSQVQPQQPSPADPPEEGEETDPWAEFADAVDENGQKTHPYFAQLAPLMGYIMRRDGHEDMERAYQEALYSLPQAREGLLQKERQNAAQKQAEVDRAKRAAALQARAASGTTAAVGNRKKKIDDLIAQAEEELAG